MRSPGAMDYVIGFVTTFPRTLWFKLSLIAHNGAWDRLYKRELRK